MATEVRLPQFGMGMQEGTLLKWLKAEGDAVQEGEAIAEIEAAKSVVEITAPATGVISQLLVQVDQTVPVQALLAILDSSTPAETSLHASAAHAAQSSVKVLPDPGQSAARQIEPRARRLALEHKIDLGAVAGTGRVTEADVKELIDQRDRASRGAGSTACAPARGAVEALVETAGRGLEEQNLRLVRDVFYAAIAVDDWERAESVLDHDLIEVHEADGLPYGGVWKGIEGFRRITKLMLESWKPVQWKVLQYAAGGDLVMVYFQLSGTGKNGMAFSMPVVEIWRCKNGKVVELRVMYWDTKRIRECAGL